jgi:RNA polymerase sigma-70 factor (ECF subfamily)
MAGSRTQLSAPVCLGLSLTLPPFAELYDAHANFVFRALSRLGVPSAALDDAVQDVFLVVLRRSADFEGRSSARTWIHGITLRVARKHRGRSPEKHEHDPDQAAGHAPTPEQSIEHAREVQRIDEILRSMDDSLREVFVLAELQQLTAPEIATALDVKLNTVYSRLRLARERFEAALLRDRARARHEVGA